MADDYQKFLDDLARRTGASVESSDLARLGELNPEDVEAHKRKLEEQYEKRGAPTSHRSQDSQSLDQSQNRDPRTEQGSGSQSVTDSWTSSGGGSGGSSNTIHFTPTTPAPGIPDWYRQMQEELQAQLTAEREARAAEAAARAEKQRQDEAKAAAAEAQRIAQRDTLYGQLHGRATQSLNVSASDPIIAQQTAAYSAQQERARQNYLADLAERSGSLANLTGEQRLSAERQGAQVAQFQADKVGQELVARRGEITDALSQIGNMLTAEQQQALQKELGLLNNQIQQRQIDVSARGQDISQLNAMLMGGLTARGQDIDWQQGLLGNQMQWQIEQLRNEQAMRDLGLRAEDRAAYWDAVRRGLL